MSTAPNQSTEKTPTVKHLETSTQSRADQLVDLNDMDHRTYEQLLGRALHDIRESLDERISRDQLERVLLSSEAHPYEVLEAIQHLALIVLTDEPCPWCDDFDCEEDHRSLAVIDTSVSIEGGNVL